MSDNGIDFDKITTLFFDLDGTLLNLNEKEFTDRYVALIFKYFKELLSKDRFYKGFWDGTSALIAHDKPDTLVLESFLRLLER